MYNFDELTVIFSLFSTPPFKQNGETLISPYISTFIPAKFVVSNSIFS